MPFAFLLSRLMSLADGMSIFRGGWGALIQRECQIISYLWIRISYLVKRIQCEYVYLAPRTIRNS